MYNRKAMGDVEPLNKSPQISPRDEQTVADHAHFVLSDEQWKAFNYTLERPVRILPRLRRLLSEPSVLQR